MSISIITTGKSIQNNGPKAGGIDISTRNAQLSTVVGYMAGENNQGFYNTFVGRAAGQMNDNGASNVFLGNDAGNQNISGNNNTFLGVGAGESNYYGSDNIFLGLGAGAYNISGNKNVFLGNYAGAFLNGQNNVLIGYSASLVPNAQPNSSNNVGIGTNTKVFGYYNTAIGTSNDVSGREGVVYGINNVDKGFNNMILGKNVANEGSNNIILWNRSSLFTTSNNNMLNINDQLVMSGSTLDGPYDMLALKFDNMYLGGSNTNISISPSNCTIATSNIFNVNSSNIIEFNNNANHMIMTQDQFLIEASAHTEIVTGSNLFFRQASNGTLIQSLVNDTASTFEQQEQGTRISSTKNVSLSNPCNQITLSNESLYLDSFCGDIVNNFTGTFYAGNFNNSNNSAFALTSHGTASLVATHGTEITGRVTTNNGINIVDGFQLYRPGVSNVWWKEEIELNSASNAADLIFESVNGTRVTFVDEFQPDVLNFTGKHRCILEAENEDPQSLLGRIVIATGRYRNLKDEPDLEMDEAIPIVALSTKASDKRVFGVIGGFDKKGCFHIGNIQFLQPFGRDRAIVQNVGEGCILVSDCNGPLENGDLIVSSDLPGYGMKQESDIVTNCTVAKITADCDFKSVKPISIGNKKVRVCIVGCKYY